MQRAEQQGDQGGDGGARWPHNAEAEADLLAAVAAVGVLGHDGGGQDVVGADADAEQEADEDEAPEIGGEGLRGGHDGHDGDVEAVEFLAAALGEGAEDQRADSGADQGGASQQAGLQAGQFGEAEGGEDEREDEADRGQVVAVGEHAHAGGEQRQPVEAFEGLFIEFRKAMCTRHRRRLPVSMARWVIAADGREGDTSMKLR